MNECTRLASSWLAYSRQASAEAGAVETQKDGRDEIPLVKSACLEVFEAVIEPYAQTRCLQESGSHRSQSPHNHRENHQAYSLSKDAQVCMACPGS